jgi:hypothetical protein
MLDVIIKFTVPLGYFRGHHVSSPWRIAPARWSIFDRLAEDEPMGHFVRAASSGAGGMHGAKNHAAQSFIFELQGSPKGGNEFGTV